MPETQPDLIHLATQYHDALPMRIREYLNHRGITDPVLDTHLLGWNGERITIPIFKREGGVAFFKLAKDPEDKRPGPKMLLPAGQKPELYGWERVRAKPCLIVICEGEFDRLVLERHGFSAVTSTAGAGTFFPEWAQAIREIPEVYVCFDRDEAGRNGARHVAGLIPHAKVIELPNGVGEGGDITDFFVRLRQTREEFLELFKTARSLPPSSQPDTGQVVRQGLARYQSAEVARIKERVSIKTLIERYLQLQRAGRFWKGICPFHDDHEPSFWVYPLTGTFYCFGCKAHGDVIDFVKRIEKMTFPEAVQLLQRLAR